MRRLMAGAYVCTRCVCLRTSPSSRRVTALRLRQMDQARITTHARAAGNRCVIYGACRTFERSPLKPTIRVCVCVCIYVFSSSLILGELRCCPGCLSPALRRPPLAHEPLQP